MPNDSTGNVQKTARIHDKANDTYIDDIEFPLPDLTTKTLKLSPSIIGRSRRARRPAPRRGPHWRRPGSILKISPKAWRPQRPTSN